MVQVQQTAQLQAQVAAKDKFIVTLRETLTSAGDQGSQNSLTAQGRHASFGHMLSDFLTGRTSHKVSCNAQTQGAQKSVKTH